MTEPKLMTPEALLDTQSQWRRYGSFASKRVDELFNHIAAQQARIEAIQRRVYEMLDAIENGAIDSTEIDLGDGAQPFKLHEEWAHHARRTISATPPPDPVREHAHELLATLDLLVGHFNAFVGNDGWGNQADAYYCLAKGAQDSWEKAKAAIAKARPEAEG